MVLEPHKDDAYIVNTARSYLQFLESERWRYFLVPSRISVRPRTQCEDTDHLRKGSARIPSARQVRCAARSDEWLARRGVRPPPRPPLSPPARSDAVAARRRRKTPSSLNLSSEGRRSVLRQQRESLRDDVERRLGVPPRRPLSSPHQYDSSSRITSVAAPWSKARGTSVVRSPGWRPRGSASACGDQVQRGRAEAVLPAGRRSS